MRRIRTIKQAVSEIKAVDPGSAISYHAIRTAILEGKIPATRAGCKYMIDLDLVMDYFAGGTEA